MNQRAFVRMDNAILTRPRGEEVFDHEYLSARSILPANGRDNSKRPGPVNAEPILAHHIYLQRKSLHYLAATRRCKLVNIL